MSPIKHILIKHQQGMDELVPYVIQTLQDVMNCFPQYKDKFPIINLGNWESPSARIQQNGITRLTPYQSVDWYLKRAQQQAIRDGRWQSGRQLHIGQILSDLSQDPYFTQMPQWGIMLVKNDLYATAPNGKLLNYCLGCTHPNAFSVISTYRFVDKFHRLNLENFLTCVQHEFGHILGLTEGNRPNTTELLGPHCTRPKCVMQQRLNGDLTDITQERLKHKARHLTPFCPDCITQGQKHLAQLCGQIPPNSPRRLPNGGR